LEFLKPSLARSENASSTIPGQTFLVPDDRTADGNDSTQVEESPFEEDVQPASRKRRTWINRINMASN
jgi:hypothetical protein